MLPIILSAFCSSIGSEIANWFSITVFVILASIVLAALIYTISNLLPTSYRNKLKNVSRQEMIEVAFSIILVIVLIMLTSASCSVSSALTGSITNGNSSDALTFSRIYISNMIFNTGNNVLINIYAESVKFLVAAQIIDIVASYNVITRVDINKDNPLIGRLIYTSPGKQIKIDAYVSPEFAGYLYGYSTMFNMLSSFVVVTFGGLFILFLLLPIIQAIGLTLLIPIAIAMRSISFSGEHLRQASNSLIALAIGFYFILPLAITSNAYMVQWLFCTNPGTACNPTPQFVGSYTITTPSSYTTLFNAAPTSLTFGGINIGAPLSFFGISASGAGLNTALGYIWYAFTLAAFSAVPKAVAISAQVSQFMLQGIVLIALDMGITSGFIIGIYKSLDTISKMFGIGPFWG